MNISKKSLFNCLEGIGFALFIVLFTKLFLLFLSGVISNFFTITAGAGGGPGGEIALVIYAYILLPFIFGIYILKLLPSYEKWLQQKVGFYSPEGKCLLILLGTISLFVFFTWLAAIDQYTLGALTQISFIVGILYLIYMIPRLGRAKSKENVLLQIGLSLFLILLAIGFLLREITYPPMFYGIFYKILNNLLGYIHIIYGLAILAIGYVIVFNKDNNFVKKLLLAMYLLLPLVWVMGNLSRSFQYDGGDINLWILGIGTFAWFVGIKFLMDFLKIKQFWRIIMIAMFIVLIEATFIITYQGKYTLKEIIVAFSPITLVLIIFTFMSIGGLIREAMKNI